MSQPRNILDAGLLFYQPLVTCHKKSDPALPHQAMTKRIIWKCRKKQILVSWKSSGPLWLKSEQRLCNKITEDDIR